MKGAFQKTLGLFVLLVLLASGCGNSSKTVVSIQMPSEFATASELNGIRITVEAPDMETIVRSFPLSSTTGQTFELMVDVGEDRLFTVVVKRVRDTDPFPSLEKNNSLQTGFIGTAVSDISFDVENVVPITLRPINFADDTEDTSASLDIETIEWFTQQGAPFCGQLANGGESVLILTQLAPGFSSAFDALIVFDVDDDPATGGSSEFINNMFPNVNAASIGGAERLIHISTDSGQLARLIDLEDGDSVLLTAQGEGLQRTYDVGLGILTVCLSRSDFLQQVSADGAGSYNVLVAPSGASEPSDIAHEVRPALYDLSFVIDGS